MSEIGQQIRAIANEIEAIDPSKAPFFMGIERPTPSVARCMFQTGPIIGERAGLAHAQQILAEVKAVRDHNPLPAGNCGRPLANTCGWGNRTACGIHGKG